MPKFTVDLGDVQLTEAEHSAVASAIHSAVIGQLARVGDAAAHSGTKTLTRAGMGLTVPPSDSAPAGKPAKGKGGKKATRT